MHQLPTILLQPPDTCLVVRDHPGHFGPEAGRVVHLFSVAELVNDDVVEDLGRCQKKEAVEIEVAFGTAASPAGLLAADRDGSVVDADERRKVSDALGDHNRSPLLEAAQLGVCKSGDRIGFFLRLAGENLRAVDADPFALIVEEGLYVLLGNTHGGAHNNAAIGLDFHGECFSITSDQFIFHVSQYLRARHSHPRREPFDARQS